MRTCGYPVSSKQSLQSRGIHPHVATPPPQGPAAINHNCTSCIIDHIYPRDLRDSNHVFLGIETTSNALSQQRDPLKVIAHTDKTLTIVVRGRQVNVSADRVKPAYLFEGTQHDTGRPIAKPRHRSSEIVTTRPQPTIYTGRSVRFPTRFNT